MIEKRFYKKTMASGKEYFLAEVIEKTKCFFGLITFKEKFNIAKNDRAEWFLHNYTSFNQQFNTLQEAEKAANEAIENRKQEILESTELSYKLIKKQ